MFYFIISLATLSIEIAKIETYEEDKIEDGRRTFNEEDEADFFVKKELKEERFAVKNEIEDDHFCKLKEMELVPIVEEDFMKKENEGEC